MGRVKWLRDGCVLVDELFVMGDFAVGYIEWLWTSAVDL